jgi:hypothetical protein
LRHFVIHFGDGFAHGRSLEFETVCVVDDAIEYGVGERRLPDDVSYIAPGGQIVDASIVPVPRNHNTRDENAAIKRGEVPEDWADKPAKLAQKDVDARWTKKHGKSHYGYKNHVERGPHPQIGAPLSRHRRRCA